MFAIILDGAIEALVGTTEGYDLTGRTVVALDGEIVALSQAGIALSFDGSGLVPALAQAKAMRAAGVDAMLESKKRQGFIVPSGAAAGAILQTRDADDTSNWLTLKDGVRDAISAGMGALPGVTFRTAANEMVPATFDEALTVLNALRDYGFALLQHSFALKDAILAAADNDELNAIDITTGWPS